ncbi:unnamed protein product [Onchocerca ochengi]|uniref:ZP domain-containing protein n=1 Tax=Onchocerca ochengi TaxID=42157 RepID=A0A182ER94_ONCOC|nr:unnamed protein product [Onchocerca ochengi]
MPSFTTMDLLLLLFSLIELSLSSLNIVQNAIIGQPLIECGNEFIRFSIKTVKPFQGKIFVKGQYENSDCSRNYNAIDSIHTTNSEEIMINSAQNEIDSLEEANKTTSFTPSSQSMNESSRKTSSTIDTAESFKDESRKRNSDATMHDYQSNFITTKPLSSKHADFNANHEYGNSIFGTTSTISSHCPPCPTCHDEFKVDKQREITESIVDLLIKLGTCNIEFEQQY